MHGPVVWHTLRVARTTFARCRLRQTECRESLEASVRDCCAPGGRYLTYRVTRLCPVFLCSDSLETRRAVRTFLVRVSAHVQSNPVPGSPMRQIPSGNNNLDFRKHNKQHRSRHGIPATCTRRDRIKVRLFGIVIFFSHLSRFVKKKKIHKI